MLQFRHVSIAPSATGEETLPISKTNYKSYNCVRGAHMMMALPPHPFMVVVTKHLMAEASEVIRQEMPRRPLQKTPEDSSPAKEEIMVTPALAVIVREIRA
jgi:hypothetical protein